MAPFFFEPSSVKQALLTTNQVKHFTLVGPGHFHMFLNNFDCSPFCTIPSFLYALFTVNCPSQDVWFRIGPIEIKNPTKQVSPLLTFQS